MIHPFDYCSGIKSNNMKKMLLYFICESEKYIKRQNYFHEYLSDFIQKDNQRENKITSLQKNLAYNMSHKNMSPRKHRPNKKSSDHVELIALYYIYI
jgi:hypothetical protein